MGLVIIECDAQSYLAMVIEMLCFHSTLHYWRMPNEMRC